MQQTNENAIKKQLFDGVDRIGVHNSLREDLYYYVIEASWPRVIILFFSFYLVSNFLFALLYFLIPNSLSGMETIHYWDCFFFSVQTMATIGYGALSPTGYLANFLVVLEAAFGLIGVAILTGLVFAKISKPYAKIRFSKNAILSNFDGVRCLSFRMGNIRGNDIVEANVNVSALIDEETQEGQFFRRIYDLKLRRAYTPFFKLSWSLFHPLDEDSPIQDFEGLGENLKAIAVTVTGHDGTYSTTVYSRHIYAPEEIIKGKYFKDILEHPKEGNVKINYQFFDDLI